MRVLQLIDSLRSGGAEKMSVSYANALAKRIDGSYLCCTRMEGLLKKEVTPEVGYLFLHKRSRLDISAFLKLRKFIQENKIDIIQAHSSSWFLALIVKLSSKEVKLIWHDHYGRELGERKSGLLRPASRFFDGVIVVNSALQRWSQKNLYCRNIKFFRNFLPDNSISDNKVDLKGGDSFKIVCVANFRPQKDHLTLLKAFKQVVSRVENITLHLIGKFKNDDYTKKIKSYIIKNYLQDKVFVYGEQEKPFHLLGQANLGVLSSVSEGLPLALLEYGYAGLPVICTEVGECPEVIKTNGILVPPGKPDVLVNAFLKYFSSKKRSQEDAKAFQREIIQHYTEQNVIVEVVEFFSSLRKR
ncbi:glycosyltransferase [Salinimicrobium catena]|uniref:glycosyltransferase n=1 Tax=Salinimicrobium catena TaxID=390640 RepID=UPI002FE4F2D1